MEVTQSKASLVTFLKLFFDELRNRESLTGEKALRNITYLLCLRLFEKHLIKNFCIDDYDFSHYMDHLVDKIKISVTNNTKLENLVSSPDICRDLKIQWSDIYAKHTVLQHIFLEDKFFDIKKNSTFKMLLDKIIKFPFEDIEEDILGEAYEEVIKDIMTGKILGQFFTPPCV